MDISGSSLPPPDDSRKWTVVHTRPRSEKKVAEFCDGKNIVCYLPQLSRKHRYGRRQRTYQVPLFGGYLFVLVDQAQSALLRSNARIANVLVVCDQALLYAQLTQVKCALDSQSAVELFPHLTVGMKVCVKAGPLQGVEGFIERIKGKTRVILNIDFIQQSIAVEVEAEWLLTI